MNKPKLLFVYDLKNEKYWMDGLWAALNILEEDFKIYKHNIATHAMTTEGLGHMYDFILGWGGFNSRVDNWVKGDWISNKKGLCIGGNAFLPTGADNYDILFYETKWYRPQISFHKNIVHAFGVNTDIYNTIDLPVPILWDYVGVGSFAKWKRWEKMVDKKGNKLVIGEYQDNNESESLEIVRDLVKGGVMVSNATNPYDLSMFYHSARTLYMPSDIYGGGERAIWEAKASGLSVEIEEDNPKLKELVDSEVKDHYWYAEQLKKGIMSVL